MKYISLILLVVLCACEKDYTPKKDIVFGVEVDGYTASFKNQTTGGKSYKWDFGDGQTSTDENPTHVYAGKGKYVPSFQITLNDGSMLEGSTVLRISKSTAVKLSDNTLSDWDTVVYNVVTVSAANNVFKKAKFDYDGNFVYFYFEVESAEANGDIYDFYVDSDNNGGTGYLTGSFPGAGIDVLVEGALLDEWFDVFYHAGAQTAWAWGQQSISEFYEIGKVEEAGGIMKFEGRIARSKIKGLTGKGLKIGVNVSANTWAQIGGTPVFFLDMTE